MNKCQIAEYFDVSRPTVNDWQRRGAPIGKNGGDLAEVATWRASRELEKHGLAEAAPDLPGLIGEHTRRQIDLSRRIDLVNAWPPDVTVEPGLIKAAMCGALLLERELLDVAPKLINSPGEVYPQAIIRAVLAALDRAKADPEENTETPNPSSPSPEKRRAVASGRGTAGRGKRKGGSV